MTLSCSTTRDPHGEGEPATIVYRDDRVLAASLPPLTFRNPNNPAELARALGRALQDASDDAGPPLRVLTGSTGRPLVGTNTLTVVFAHRAVVLWSLDKFQPTGVSAVLTQWLRAADSGVE